MKSNNSINVPQAKAAMEQFKMQAAQEVGVNLTNGYNGHLTSREALRHIVTARLHLLQEKLGIPHHAGVALLGCLPWPATEHGEELRLQMPTAHVVAVFQRPALFVGALYAVTM